MAELGSGPRLLIKYYGSGVMGRVILDLYSVKLGCLTISTVMVPFASSRETHITQLHMYSGMMTFAHFCWSDLACVHRCTQL